MAYSSPRLQASRAFPRFVQRSLGNIYGYLHSYVFFFQTFLGRESQRGKELTKERKEKQSPASKGKTRNRQANLDENQERRKRKFNTTPIS